MKAYLAGPMRGHERWNFPAFDSAAAALRYEGWDIVSPAELDRALGFDETMTELPEGFIEAALRRDIDAILGVEAIVLLPGWEASKGVAIELTVAKALGLPDYMYDPHVGKAFEVLHTERTVLQEADWLVHGDRGADYGHPIEDFTRTGRMWGAILGIADVAPDLVGLCMVALKVSREVNKPKRDNRVDGAGYFACVDRVRQRLDAE